MRSSGSSGSSGDGAAPSARRRIAIVAVVVGVVVGALTGAALLSGASKDVAGPRPEVLHVAPALVDADAEVSLTAATFCVQPKRPTCAVVGARAWVRPEGAAGWSRVSGRASDGAFRFDVPGALVPEGGFSYWLEFRAADGGAVPYPPGGARSPIRVLTTSGLPTRALGEVDWGAVRPPDGVVVKMPYGRADGEVGRSIPEGGEGQILAQGGFDVGSDGSVWVEDWVNGRIQVFGPSGRYRRAFRSPTDRPADIAVGPDSVVLSTLGQNAKAFELTARGQVVGRYPVGYGLAVQAGVAPDGPRVLVGPSQWAAVRSAPGRPIEPELQAQLQTATPPTAGGSVGLSQSLPGGRIAFVWVRSDGSRAGVVLRLPRGVQPGTDYFVRPLPDGGAVAARGLWDDTHYAVALLELDPTGAPRSFTLLPEPSQHQVGRISTVRFRAPNEVLVAMDRRSGVAIERFDLEG